MARTAEVEGFELYLMKSFVDHGIPTGIRRPSAADHPDAVSSGGDAEDSYLLATQGK